MLSRIFGKKNKITSPAPPSVAAGTNPTQAEIDRSFLFAVQSHDLAKAKQWAAMGADINTAENGHTPALISSLRDKNLEITDWLLTQNPDLELEDKLGKTALMTAADNGSDWVSKIIKAGARLDTKSHKGWTALEHALREKRANSAATLIEAMQNPDASLSDGSNPADYARENGLDQLADKIEEKRHRRAAAQEAAMKPDTKQPVTVMKKIRFRKPD
jgi:hypothetical protein